MGKKSRKNRRQQQEQEEQQVLHQNQNQGELPVAVIDEAEIDKCVIGGGEEAKAESVEVSCTAEDIDKMFESEEVNLEEPVEVVISDDVFINWCAERDMTVVEESDWTLTLKNLEAHKDRVNELSDMISGLTTEKTKLEESVGNFAEENRVLREKLEKASEYLNNSKNIINNLKKEIATLKEENNKLKTTVSEEESAEENAVSEETVEEHKEEEAPKSYLQSKGIATTDSGKQLAAYLAARILEKRANK